MAWVAVGHVCVAAAREACSNGHLVQSVAFAKSTVKISYEGSRAWNQHCNVHYRSECAAPDGKLAIDYATTRALEIIANARTGKHEKSLFGVMNHTQVRYPAWYQRVCSHEPCVQTRVGNRLLRATLLAPSNDLVTVNLRLDCVSVLLAHQDLFFHCHEVQPGLLPTRCVSTILLTVLTSGNRSSASLPTWIE